MAANLNDPDPSNYILSPMNVENNMEDKSPMDNIAIDLCLLQNKEHMLTASKYTRRSNSESHLGNIHFGRVTKTRKDINYTQAECEPGRCMLRNLFTQVREPLYQKNLRLAALNGNMDLLMRCLRTPTVDVNCISEVGRSALHYATKIGRLDMVEELLKHGADVNAQDIRGNTPLHLVIMWSIWTSTINSIVILLLKYGALVDIQNHIGRNPLDIISFKLNAYQTGKLILTGPYTCVTAKNLNNIKMHLTIALSGEKDQIARTRSIKELGERFTTTENSTDTKNF